MHALHVQDTGILSGEKGNHAASVRYLYKLILTAKIILEYGHGEVLPFV